MKKITTISLVIAGVLSSVVFQTHAAIVTFTFGAGADNQTSFDVVGNDANYTLTVSAPSPATAFDVDGDGLGLGEFGSFLSHGNITSFVLTFTGPTDLMLDSYTVGYANAIVGGDVANYFTMSGGVGSSTGNGLATTGVHTANGDWTLAPSQSGTLTATIVFGTAPLTQIQSLSFETVEPVPEPSTWLAAGFVGLLVVGRYGRTIFTRYTSRG